MKKSLFLALLLSTATISFSQKKPLDHSVYDSWQHIGEKKISNDGKWVVYSIDPQQGDNELIVQSADGVYKRTIPRGYNASISADSRFLVFKIKPFFKDTREAKIKNLPANQQGKKAVEMPKDSLGILELWRGNLWKTDKVKSYKMPKESSGWVGYIPDKSADQPANSNESENASDLVIKSLLNGTETIFYKTLEFYFSKTGEKLLVEQTKNPNDSFSTRQVLLYDLPNGKTTILSRGGNDFAGFAMTNDGSQIAYTAERDANPKELQKFYKLWYYASGMDSAQILADRYSTGMMIGTMISPYDSLEFSKSGKRLFFRTMPIPAPIDTTLVDFEHAKLDIWHYNDDYLQTFQAFPSRLKRDKQQGWLAVFDFETKTIKQLGSREVTQVMMTNEGDGEVFAGVTDFNKRVEVQWTGTTKKDIYAIIVNSGVKKLLKENLTGQAYVSSTGKYIIWYDRVAKNYFIWDGSNTRNLTEKIKQPLWNEENDLPQDPNNYGVMGWEANDEKLYIYDRYGVWIVDPTGNRNPVKAGLPGSDSREKSVYRYIKTDPDEKFLDPNNEYLFRVFNELNKNYALFRTNFYTAGQSYPPQFENYKIDSIRASKGNNVFIYTKETFSASPDIYVSQDPGSMEIKLSAINPRQKEYNWGTAELFRWKAYNGKEATGIIYKPEDFNPKKKYPMIVYFYEKLSRELFDYKEPAPIRSSVNVPFFVSRGYMIFIPDIEYKIGHPGKSAYDYIVSGSRALVKKGWVDSTKIALQGHSWGGYQAAQVATMTKLFAAVWAGAPVANMTSAYGGIRWESGVSRQWQYEKAQSRIGGSLWEKLPLYIENSPLFHLDKVTAPMVIMANDNDGAVPWYQGIELFTALRRLGKKVWMLNYNGQGHGLTQRQDMLDYHIRMQQFFDWKLKGDKAAKWITEGVQAVNKGKDWGFKIDE